MAVSPLLLRQFAQFAHWPDDALGALAENLRLRQLARRQIALGDTELGDSVAWVIEGAVWLVDHAQDDREYVLGRYGAGEMFGELHALGNATRLPVGINYLAACASHVALVKKSKLLALIGSQPAIAEQMVLLLAERSCDFFRWRSILALPSAVERIIAVLEALAEPTSDHKGRIPAGITQQEIAAYANTTRETVTRTMQKLQTSGAALRDENGWQIDPAKLKAGQLS